MKQAILCLLAGVVFACVNPGLSSGVSPHLADIRFCESSNNYQAESTISTASGGYQFLDTTWQGYKTGYARAKDAPPSVQDKIATREYAKNGDSPWLESKPCWSKR